MPTAGCSTALCGSSLARSDGAEVLASATTSLGSPGVLSRVPEALLAGLGGPLMASLDALSSSETSFLMTSGGPGLPPADPGRTEEPSFESIFESWPTSDVTSPSNGLIWSPEAPSLLMFTLSLASPGDFSTSRSTLRASRNSSVVMCASLGFCSAAASAAAGAAGAAAGDLGELAEDSSFEDMSDSSELPPVAPASFLRCSSTMLRYFSSQGWSQTLSPDSKLK
mmetsp:Transcript_26081/g.82516  ORF Transcript_26081/g.82516 Transcript_26081/m.82516 type:complete len:225 (+) Transcript_26081:1382-2056(+)